METRLEAVPTAWERAMTLAVGLADSLALRALRARGFRSRHEASSLGPLHVLEGEGTGPIPILVVLHGLGAAATDMGPLMLAVRSLAVRILVPDLPGHGLNPDVPGSSMEQQEQAVVEVLDRLLEDQPAVVYGNSLGGIVALRYALRRPDRVAGVMVASPGGARTTEEEHRLVMSSFRSDTLRNSAALVARVFPNLWFRQHFVVGMSIRLRRPAARGFLLEARYDQTFLPEELAALRAPILLSWGADERVFPPSHLAFFKRSLPPHAEIQEPEGHGHSAFIKDARGVAAQLRKFSHSPSGDPRR